MGEKLEKQFVVSRRKRIHDEDADYPFRPWKVFDSRSVARSFCKAKIASSDVWQYAIDAVTRGPRA